MGNDLFFKNCLSLLLRTEDIVEIFDEKIGEEDKDSDKLMRIPRDD